MSSQSEKKRGVVMEALPNTHFKVVLECGTEINAHLAGRLRMHRIKILPGDTVTVEVNDYDKEKGRIVFRG